MDSCSLCMVYNYSLAPAKLEKYCSEYKDKGKFFKQKFWKTLTMLYVNDIVMCVLNESTEKVRQCDCQKTMLHIIFMIMMSMSRQTIFAIVTVWYLLQLDEFTSMSGLVLLLVFVCYMFDKSIKKGPLMWNFTKLHQGWRNI
jgi:hypothetical protein